MGTLRLSATVSARDAEEHKINTLEHVQITLTIEHGRRGDIEVIIACPSGMNLEILVNFRLIGIQPIHTSGELLMDRFSAYVYFR